MKAFRQKKGRKRQNPRPASQLNPALPSLSCSADEKQCLIKRWNSIKRLQFPRRFSVWEEEETIRPIHDLLKWTLWFFTFGIVGFSILVFPIFLFGAGAVMYIVKNRLLMKPEVLLSGLAVVLGLGASFTAGHVLSSPGSGIYVLLALAYVFCFSAFYSTSLYKSRVK